MNYRVPLVVIMSLLCSDIYSQSCKILQPYFGLLHAHSMVCDGEGTPQEAFTAARIAGLHFFALTPHNHADAEGSAGERRDGLQIATDTTLYMDSYRDVEAVRQLPNGNRELVYVVPVQKAAREATTQNFVGLYGQEFSTMFTGNHVNVLNVGFVLRARNGDYKGLLKELATRAPEYGFGQIIQLNHPDVEADLFYDGSDLKQRKQMYNDYGIDKDDLGPDYVNWAFRMGHHVRLIELISGSAMEKERMGVAYKSHEEDYYFYLTQGLHISPSAGQDNHYKTWGTASDVRVGVYANKLTEGALYGAMRWNRTFVTEDKNLAVHLDIDDEFMGASIARKPGTKLVPKVYVSDADEPNAEYDIAIIGGEIRPQLSTKAKRTSAASAVVSKRTYKGNGYCVMPDITARPNTFYYARISQNGKERAWTSPIWVNEVIDIRDDYFVDDWLSNAEHPRAHTRFYWSVAKGATKYHRYYCPYVEKIKPEHLKRSNIVPAGRALHDCKQYVSKRDFRRFYP